MDQQTFLRMLNAKARELANELGDPTLAVAIVAMRKDGLVGVGTTTSPEDMPKLLQAGIDVSGSAASVPKPN